MAKAEKSTGRRAAFIRWAPLLIWTAVILFLSSGQGSMSQTSLFIRPLLEFLFPDAPETTLLIYHGYIRKSAHFFAYAVLGLLACRAFCRVRAVGQKRYWPLLAVFYALAVAATDEFNQSMQASRTGSIGDVILDMSGAVTAVLLFWIAVRIRPHKP